MTALCLLLLAKGALSVLLRSWHALDQARGSRCSCNNELLMDASNKGRTCTAECSRCKQWSRSGIIQGVHVQSNSTEVNVSEAARRPEVSANLACSATPHAHCYATPTALHNGLCYYYMTTHPQPIVIHCHLYRTISHLLPPAPIYLLTCLPADNLANNQCSLVLGPGPGAGTARRRNGPPWRSQCSNGPQLHGLHKEKARIGDIDDPTRAQCFLNCGPVEHDLLLPVCRIHLDVLNTAGGAYAP